MASRLSIFWSRREAVGGEERDEDGLYDKAYRNSGWGKGISDWVPRRPVPGSPGNTYVGILAKSENHQHISPVTWGNRGHADGTWRRFTEFWHLHIQPLW